MGQKKDSKVKLFRPVHIDLQCVLFFKTHSTIDPVDLVHRICTEIVANTKIRRMKYVNRLTPTTIFGKANEKGLEDLSSDVLGKYFNLITPKEEGEEGSDNNPLTNGTAQDSVNHSVSAIFLLPTIRRSCRTAHTYILHSTQTRRHRRLC